jgi:ribosomal protein S18 acetylase RimI-like enzyme
VPTDQVRLARTSDVDDVARVQVAAWRETYVGLLPAVVLAALDPDEIAFEWGRALLTATDHRLLVAVNADGTLVGAVAIGPGSDPDLAESREPRWGEISLLVVDPAARGQGHGSRLLSAAVDHLRETGDDAVAMWIPVDDEPMRAFLVSAGFGPDSAHRDRETGDGPLREVRLVADITA